MLYFLRRGGSNDAYELGGVKCCYERGGIKCCCFLGVEGSNDAYERSLVQDITVQHDFSKGPFWTDKIYDMVWSIEFLEHVDTDYIPNYMATYKKARILLVSHSK